MDTKETHRPIIQDLLRTRGNDLYISGDAILTSLTFALHFLDKRTHIYRPTFLLQPHKEKENPRLVLTFGDIPDKDRYPGKGNDFTKECNLSDERRTVLFFNSVPSMYIFRENDVTEKELRDIRRGTAFDNGIGYSGDALSKKVSDIGLIQSSVLSVTFTFTVDHGKMHAGRFTLAIKD